MNIKIMYCYFWIFFLIKDFKLDHATVLGFNFPTGSCTSSRFCELGRQEGGFCPHCHRRKGGFVPFQQTVWWEYSTTRPEQSRNVTFPSEETEVWEGEQLAPNTTVSQWYPCPRGQLTRPDGGGTQSQDQDGGGVTKLSVPTRPGRARSTVLLRAGQIALKFATTWITAMSTWRNENGPAEKYSQTRLDVPIC